MKTAGIWKYIHAERAAVADTLEGLTPQQWAAPSWCGHWTVHMTAAHILVAAEQTPGRFYSQLLRAGLRFDSYAERTAQSLVVLDPSDLVARLRARTTTTNRPPAPTIAMLGEIVTHGADIRMALGLEHRPDEAALVAVADNYSRTNLLIGAKKRIAGLRLAATDCNWSTGTGQNRRPLALPHHGHERPAPGVPGSRGRRSSHTGRPLGGTEPGQGQDSRVGSGGPGAP